jgi:hypothetical protein
MAAMLAAIPTKFFHYTSQNEKNSAKPSRPAITKGLTHKKSPRKSTPDEFLQTAGEVRLISKIEAHLGLSEPDTFVVNGAAD